MRLPPQAHEEIEVLHRREVGVEHDVFRYVRQLFLGAQRFLVGDDAVDARLTGCRFDEIQEEVDRRRLTGAVAAEHRVDLPGFDGKTHIIEREQPVFVPLAQLIGFQKHPMTVRGS